MTDIVEWLRKEAELVALDRLSEAADEIDRLRSVLQEIADLRHDNTSAATIAQLATRTGSERDGKKPGKSKSGGV